MTYWLFKISDQDSYPDRPGSEYVYNNTHSVRVAGGDEFIYLKKRRTQYGLAGAGRVSRVTERSTDGRERRTPKVSRLFTAHLSDVVWFPRLFDLSARTKAGRRNRVLMGLPGDLNSIGWSISMPRIERDLFVHLLDAALDSSFQVRTPAAQMNEADWRVDDAWSLVKRRSRMRAFRAIVLSRHEHTCVVCGTQLRSVLDAAHIRSYSSDKSQRANPANGICLCSYCHAAYDFGDITILPDGGLKCSGDVHDEIALKHFTAVSPQDRRRWLLGIENQFLLDHLTESPIKRLETGKSDKGLRN
ncbi:MAG: HNH endonuclease [Candidatus Kerfeldbacteria bacterium]|nr:HNH endonuclease [Candidatus Kerfeldbacteria bacterium]